MKKLYIIKVLIEDFIRYIWSINRVLLFSLVFISLFLTSYYFIKYMIANEELDYIEQRISLHRDGYPDIFCLGAVGGSIDLKKGTYTTFHSTDYGWQIDSNRKKWHLSRCYRKSDSKSLVLIK